MLVSIIIPVYNVEKYVRRCFQSVSEQTYQNIEIVVVDDGSTDSSGKLCDEFSRAEKRAVVIHKENGGPSSARNVGMKLARGEYITFLDSDDFLALDFVEKAMLLCENYSAEIAILDMAYIDESSNEEKNDNATDEVVVLSREDAIAE